MKTKDAEHQKIKCEHEWHVVTFTFNYFIDRCVNCGATRKVARCTASVLL